MLQFWPAQKVSSVPATMSQGTGIHWQVAQATSLMNIRVEMSTAPDTAHQGEYFEFISCVLVSSFAQVSGWRTVVVD
jgi:hypothetical protein